MNTIFPYDTVAPHEQRASPGAIYISRARVYVRGRARGCEKSGRAIIFNYYVCLTIVSGARLATARP